MSGPITAALRELMALGVEGEALIAAIGRVEDGGLDQQKLRDESAERRRAWDRQYRRNKRNCPPDIHPTKVEECDNTCPPDSTRHPPDIHPTSRAHVRDNPLEDISTGVGGGLGFAREADDWPKGDPVKALVGAVESPWLDPSKSPGLIQTSSRLVVWRRDGASWEHDVLPVVRALLANRRQPLTSFKFFDAAIARSIADNRQALTIPEARAPPAKVVSFADRLAAENAEARRLALEQMNAQHG